MTRRLLISARDPAAAYHLTEVVKHAPADSRFAVTLVAQEPALSIMRSGGLAPIPVSLEKAVAADSATACDLPAAVEWVQPPPKSRRPDRVSAVLAIQQR